MGIWLCGKMKETEIKKKARDIVRSFTFALSRKKITISQLAYLNNMCLIPKLSYMLQLTKVSTRALNSIHQPYVRLVKNKLGITRSVGNHIVTHKGLGGCKALAHDIVAKQIACLQNRLNGRKEIRSLTRLRIKQGFRDACVTNNLWDDEEGMIFRKIWKNNLACLILIRAKELKIEFNIENNSFLLENKGTRIRDVVDHTTFIKAHKVLSAQILFFINQLLDTTGRIALTWQELKLIKNMSSKGRKAKWFANLENKILENEEDRLVKQSLQTPYPNELAFAFRLDQISNDKRRKEWIIFLAKDNQKTLGQIAQKNGNQVTVEWCDANNAFRRNLESEGVSQSSQDTSARDRKFCSCVNQSRILGVVPKIVIERKNSFPSLFSSLLAESSAKVQKPGKNETRITQEIRLEERAIELIKSQNFSKGLQESLIKQYNQIKVMQNRFQVYTDGSLAESCGSKIMGASWIWVDIESNTSIVKGKLKCIGWPSSTKAELVAIWMALLVAPPNLDVEIYTDSAAAIASLGKKIQLDSTHKWIKEKNYSLVTKILDLAKSKQLMFSFVKVKGHSGNKWNEVADKLAKEGLNCEEISELNLNSNIRFKTTLSWNNLYIEGPTNTFLKRLFDFQVGASFSLAYATKNLELEEDTPHHNWSRLWKDSKNRAGIRCKTSKASKKLAFRIKCLSDEMPVLVSLKRRRPDLYRTDVCILCNESKETLDHLIVCSFFEGIWENIEDVAFEIAWSHIPSQSRDLSQLSHLKSIVLSKKPNDKLNRRISLIRGLFPLNLEAEIYKEFVECKIANKFVETFKNIVENGFREFIWQDRCRLISEWEKEEGILLRMKRNKPNNLDDVTTQVLEEEETCDQESSSSGSKKKYQRVKENSDEILRKKKEKELKWVTVWVNAMTKYITNGVKPFWFSS